VWGGGFGVVCFHGINRRRIDDMHARRIENGLVEGDDS
jgi:hypothetical protein